MIFRIKRLYWFMLRSFLPLFVMTFFICLFIVLMQFLWRFIDDLVGKGLEVSVLCELFFYAALTFVPMALPLAVLLASLMTFGNLGEQFELTAMKASGVSLIRAMKPLIVLMSFVAVGAFFFQNDVLPVAQTKMWTLVYSVKQKSPELEIPEGTFYDQIPGYNFYVERKNRESGALYDMMIYDVSRGFDNARIILADSGHLRVSDDKTHLFLELHHGEQFENLRENSAGGRSQNMPYRRETFDLKEILVAFDANFNRMDESGMRNQYVGKNIAELQATIDSVNARVDSVGAIYARQLKERNYVGVPYYQIVMTDSGIVELPQHPVAMERPLNIDSIFAGNSPSMARSYVSQALIKANHIKQDYEFKSYSMDDDRTTIRRHGIEMHKKFTLSIACLIFFFIGAPLGAIIRKGGLGAPLVISVFLFIVYYIIDNTGYKMARQGRLEVWEGIWLSSAVLAPLGVFLTYKAVKDSAVFDVDAYKNIYLRLTGKLRRELDVKEFTMAEVEPPVALRMLADFQSNCREYQRIVAAKPFFRRLLDKVKAPPMLHDLQAELNNVVDYLSNTRQHSVIALVNKYPFQLTAKSLPTVIEVNDALTDLFNKEMGDAPAISTLTQPTDGQQDTPRLD